MQADEIDKNETQIWNDITKSDTIHDINGDIKFDNVSFAYPTRPNLDVLRDVNLVARAGEITALVGASGSGKCISEKNTYDE